MIRRQDVSAPCCKLLAAALLALSGLTACGSQMDSIDNPDTRPISPAPAGIYEGRLETTKTGARNVTAFLDGDKKRFLLFTDDGELIAGGLYSASKSSISWTAQLYRKETVVVPDPEPGEPDTTVTTVVTRVQGEGVFDEEVAIDMSLTLDGGGVGSLSLDYKALRYQRRSNLASLAGQWGVENEIGLAPIVYNISQDGQINGRDETTNCTYQGSLAIIDLKYNLYRLALSELCGNTTLSTIGLATLNQSEGNDPMIEGVAIAEKSAVAFLLSKI